MKKNKGLVRIKDDRTRTNGWQARVYLTDGTYLSRFFSCVRYGEREALVNGLKWQKDAELDAAKRGLKRTLQQGAPRRWALKVSRRLKEGHDSFIVQWSPAPGQYRNTSVSIEKHGLKKAKLIAELIAEAMRLAYYASGPAAKRKREIFAIADRLDQLQSSAQK